MYVIHICITSVPKIKIIHNKITPKYLILLKMRLLNNLQFIKMYKINKEVANDFILATNLLFFLIQIIIITSIKQVL